MIKTIEEFVQLLTDSGLMKAADVFAHQDSLPPKKRPTSAEALADSLVAADKLTAYQSAQLLRGRYDGLLLGDYEILEKIGGGGMGDVFKARHRRMKRFVALKTLPPRSIEVWEGTDRFQREVEAAAKLDHPNIVAAYDAGEARNIHFLVMQYIDGGDLQAIVSARGALSVKDAVNLVLQVARGLEYAHSQQIIHRDIKPSNILVDRSGTAKIVDMGLALLREAAPAGLRERRLTQDGEIMGTAAFMSPEQAKDAHRADERSDIYSLGCTLYFLLTGQSPYRMESVVQMIESHIKKPIPSIRAVRRDVPRALEAVYKKMVAKKPEARYQSMSEVLQALAVFAPAEQPALSGVGSSGVSIDPQATNLYLEGDSVRTLMTFATARDETSAGGQRPWTDAKPVAPKRRVKLIGLIGLALLAVLTVGLVAWNPFDHLPGKPATKLDPNPTRQPDKENGTLADRDPVIARPQPPVENDAWLRRAGPPQEVAPAGKVRSFEGHEDRVIGIAFSVDSKFAGSACKDATARLWDCGTGKQIVQLEGHTLDVTAVAFSPDSSRLVTGCADRKLRFWNGQTGEHIKTMSNSGPGGIICAVFLPDNKRVLTSDWDSSIRVWDIEAEHPDRQFEGVGALVRAIAIDATGKRAICGMDQGQVTIWDIESGTVLQQLEGHDAEFPVMSVAFSPDGNYALSGSWDNSVRLWDVHTGESRLRLKATKPKAVGFLSNGGGIVFGDRDKNIRVYSVTTGEQVWSDVDEGPVDCLAVSPDGQFLLSGTDLGTICLWRLPRIAPPEAP